MMATNPLHRHSRHVLANELAELGLLDGAAEQGRAALGDPDDFKGNNADFAAVRMMLLKNAFPFKYKGPRSPEENWKWWWGGGGRSGSDGLGAQGGWIAI